MITVKQTYRSLMFRDICISKIYLLIIFSIDSSYCLAYKTLTNIHLFYTLYPINSQEPKCSFFNAVKHNSPSSGETAIGLYCLHTV